MSKETSEIFTNCYEDAMRAEAYAKLEFPGTYYLAYRDLPEIIAIHIRGKRAIDFGCGAGRSTRFLRRLGFDTTGIDISEQMVLKARELDPSGEYRVVDARNLDESEFGTYDLVLSVFTFDNIPTMEKKVDLFCKLARLLRPGGRMLNVVSSPEIYRHEWASFSTKDFPDNLSAKSGDVVRIIMKDVEDRRPVVDIIWSDEDYKEVYRRAGLELVETYRPLATEDVHFQWVNETRIAPWIVYVLKILE